MNPNFQYSEDDTMNPIYCVQCRKHIPRAMSVQGNGLCTNCIEADEQAVQAKIAAQASVDPTIQMNPAAMPVLQVQRRKSPWTLIAALSTIVLVLTIAGTPKAVEELCAECAVI